MARKCIKSDYSRSHGFLTDGSAGLHPDQIDQSEGIEFLQPSEEWPDTGTAPASRPDDAENEEWRRYLRKREERSQVKFSTNYYKPSQRVGSKDRFSLLDYTFDKIRLSSFLQSSSISSPITHPAAGRKNPRSSLRSPDSPYRPFLSHLLKQIPDKEVILFVVQGFRDLVEQCRY